MRQYSAVLLIAFVLFYPAVASAELSRGDKDLIRQEITAIEQSMEKGDAAAIVSLLSPNALPDLKNEIEEVLGDKKIRFKEEINSWIGRSSSVVEVKGTFSASGANWSTQGLGNYYIFEKVNELWLLRDTDSFRKLNPKFWWVLLKKIMMFALPVFLLTSVFWIWMLVDCLNRSGKDKLLWVMVLVFLNILGAILYFFIERKKALPAKESQNPL